MKIESKVESEIINFKLDHLQEILQEIDELTARSEEIKDFIKEMMGDEEELVTNKYVVKWTKVSSNRFDQSAFKRVHPDMYEAFKTLSESRRFSFK